MQLSSFIYTSIKVATLMVLLVGLASQKHAVTSFGERAAFGTFITSCFKRMGAKVIDAGEEHPFSLSQNQWKIFEIFQDADINCNCTVTCYDDDARIDMYLTYDRRPRLSDNWDGWACKQSMPSNTHSCNEPVPEEDSTCRVAVQGDRINRPHSQCNIICNIDVNTTVTCVGGLPPCIIP